MFEIGDMVALMAKNGRSYPCRLSEMMEDIKGVGIVDTKRLINMSMGDNISINERDYTIVYPSLEDRLSWVSRGAQIVLLKDSALMTALAGLRGGDRVVEAGAGSGALTIALCNAVYPDGRVFTYELRDDFVSKAKKNVDTAGYSDISDIRLGDIYKGIEEEDMAAVVLDLPEPWRVVLHAKNALRLGGVLISYSPTISQIENTVSALKKNGFVAIKCREILEREMIIKESGSRPSFDMLGHTGYILSARRL